MPGPANGKGELGVQVHPLSVRDVTVRLGGIVSVIWRVPAKALLPMFEALIGKL